MRPLLCLSVTAVLTTGVLLPREASAQRMSYSRIMRMMQPNAQQQKQQQQQMQEYQKQMQQAQEQAAAAEAKRREDLKRKADARKEKEEADREKRIARNKAAQKDKTNVLKPADEKPATTIQKSITTEKPSTAAKKP